MGAVSVGCYRVAARAVASLLGRQPKVRAIYLRRGAAVGELAFARSDIDLTLVVDEGADLVSLSEMVSRIRRLVVILGECLVFEPDDLDRWHETDPYRASQDRRTAIPLKGASPRIPRHPVSAEQAARRCAFLLEDYVPVAFRQRNRRNLTKFALDMWTAYAVAAGALEEPYPTRRQAAATYPAPRTVGKLLTSCLTAAETTHAALRPPLPPAGHMAPFRVRLPPSFEPRTVVILSSPDASPPPAACAHRAFITTREALDLYVHFVNPFAWCALPAELGLAEPTPSAFERACRFYGAPHRLREPGFVGGNGQKGLAQLDTVAFALGQLEGGQLPHARRLSEPPKATSVPDYYARLYPSAREKALTVLEALDRFAARTERTMFSVDS